VADSPKVLEVASLAAEYYTLKTAFDEQLRSMAIELRNKLGGPGTYEIPGFSITITSDRRVLVKPLLVDQSREVLLDPPLQERRLSDFLQVACPSFGVLQIG
jgi:hypothetical protein